MPKTIAKNDRLWHAWAMKIRRVALYARVSTKDKGQDTENQLAELREFCAKHEWTIVHEFVDRVSGKRSDNRPEFQKLIAAASRRQFDLVLFWALDRFSREGVLPTLKSLELLTSYGVGWKSFTEQYFDSCGIFRDAVISIMATLAEQERIKISERTIAGLVRARKAGRIGGRPRVVVDRAKIWAMNDEGQGIRKIAQALELSHGTVARALQARPKAIA